MREHRVHFFEGFLARDAARLHTSDGEPDAALVLFAEAIDAFHRAGNVPQLIITLASVPGAVRTARPFRALRRRSSARCRGSPSSFHHVPELAELGDRLAQTRRDQCGRAAGGGRGLDLDEAAVYARRQIDAARRDPRPRTRGAVQVV